MNTLREAVANCHVAVEQRLIPDVEFCKQEAVKSLQEATCTEGNATREFRIALGAKPEHADDFNMWWRDIPVEVSGLLSSVIVDFHSDEAVIRLVETRRPGYFYIFWNTLLTVCRHHGIRKIMLSNRAQEGFWEHHGFKGSRSWMTYEV